MPSSGFHHISCVLHCLADGFCAPSNVNTSSFTQQLASSQEQTAASSALKKSPLEIDELGLFNLKPRTQDIALIHPKQQDSRPEFCEPVSKSNAPTVVDSSESTHALSRSTTATSSIAERRSLKIATKQRIQLPNIKDTSADEDDVDSMLVSDILSTDRLKSEISTGRSQNTNSLATAPKISDNKIPAMMRQQTCLVEPTNFFSSTGPVQ